MAKSVCHNHALIPRTSQARGRVSHRVLLLAGCTRSGLLLTGFNDDASPLSWTTMALKTVSHYLLFSCRASDWTPMTRSCLPLLYATGVGIGLIVSIVMVIVFVVVVVVVDVAAWA